MRNGFCFDYGKKNQEKQRFIHESYTTVDRKREELKRKGYKVTKISQCIY